MKIIIFDFEVFKFDCLLGADVIHEDGRINRYQIWNLNEMKQFFESNTDALWIGHNNDAYDNHILSAILRNENPYVASKRIINSAFRGKATLKVMAYDLMCCRFYSLKMTELLVGKAIHRTEVDFNLNRPLTDEEKTKTETYNGYDLDQTYSNFLELKDPLLLRLNLLREFKIDKKYLTATEARLAAIALGAKQIDGIEKQYVAPKMYKTLQVRNQAVIDYYMSEGFRKVATGENKLTVKLCGVEHNLGSGGIHAAIKKCHETDILYLDVSGYYNLVMINYDLLPRTIPPEGKELYEYMYHQQLKLKGVDDDKRWVYKTILLAVFGASMNEHTDFYDPQIGSLITITGQMFLVDLLEKLDGKVKLIQSNTDGIMVKPLPGYKDEDILAIVDEWCNRTGFVIKPKKIAEIHQRDVNNYCYRLTNGSTDTKGDAFIGSWAVDEPVKNEFYTAKETAIVAKAVLAYFLERTPVEQTVEKYKNNLRYFQFLCKQLSYDECVYTTFDNDGNIINEEHVGDLNRGFALKSDGQTVNVIMKYKTMKDGKPKKAKMPNMPDNYFIYNDEILSDEAVKRIQDKIDYDYYVDRAYQRIAEFYDITQIKGINV